MSLFSELKRRNVFRVGATYAVLAWVLMQVADIMLPAFNAPQWVLQVFLFFLILGFPVALVLSWAFELTPEGIKKTADVDPALDSRQQTGQKLNYVFIGSVIVLLVLVAVDLSSDDAPAVPTSAAVASDIAETPPAVNASAQTVAVPTEIIADSIAVLPFANLSPDPDDAYFAAGLHDEILNQLTNLRNLKVISRQSVLRYADSQLSIAEIAKELRVSHIMEGSVRYSSDRIRVTAQLIDAVTDEHLWSETFDMDFADVFEAESSIAMNVANAMQVSFSSEEKLQLESIPTQSPEAYALYLRARSMLTGFAGDDVFNQIQELLDEAIAIDPAFAQAYVVKGDIYALRQQFELARGSYQKALKVDPSIKDPDIFEIEILYREFRYAEAKQLADALLRERPNARALLLRASATYQGLGLWDEALAFAQKVYELAPDASSFNRMGIVNSRLKQHENAVYYFQRQIQLNPGDSTPYLEMAYSLAALGRIDEAVSWISSAKDMVLGVNEENSVNPNIYSALIYANALAGQEAEVQRLFTLFKGIENEADLPTKARAYISAGELDEGLVLLEQMVRDKSLNNWNSVNAVEFLRLNPHNLPALERPEFVEVRSRL